jgi:hypothetical protein
MLAQQALGNQAMQRMFHAKHLQAKLTVNPPDDEHEKEAYQVADMEMRFQPITAVGRSADPGGGTFHRIP